MQVESPFGTAEWELYDLDSDPGETTNVSGLNSEIVVGLKQAWENYEQENNVLLIERPPAYSAGLNYYTQVE